jgi:hypothetical protein
METHKIIENLCVWFLYMLIFNGENWIRKLHLFIIRSIIIFRKRFPNFSRITKNKRN